MVLQLDRELVRARRSAIVLGLTGVPSIGGSIPVRIDGLGPQRIDDGNPFSDWPGRKNIERAPVSIGSVMTRAGIALSIREMVGTRHRRSVQNRVGSYYSRNEAPALSNSTNLEAARELDLDHDLPEESEGDDLDVHLNVMPHFASSSSHF
ncbi:MAG: hypothetical protein ACJAYU_002099 [Bradymonadia bacterium]|jgi:hypothetical protein